MKKATKVNPESVIRLKSLLSRNGVTQTQLCADTNISQNTISKIMNGKAPLTPYIAGEIIKQFPGTKYEWLMGSSPFETDLMEQGYHAIRPFWERRKRENAVNAFFRSLKVSFSLNVSEESLLNLPVSEFLNKASKNDILKAVDEAEVASQSVKAYIIKKDGEVLGYCSEEEKKILFEEIFDFAEYSISKLLDKGAD